MDWRAPLSMSVTRHASTTGASIKRVSIAIAAHAPATINRSGSLEVTPRHEHNRDHAEERARPVRLDAAEPLPAELVREHGRDGYDRRASRLRLGPHRLCDDSADRGWKQRHDDPQRHEAGRDPRERREQIRQQRRLGREEVAIRDAPTTDELCGGRVVTLVRVRGGGARRRWPCP